LRSIKPFFIFFLSGSFFFKKFYLKKVSQHDKVNTHLGFYGAWLGQCAWENEPSPLMGLVGPLRFGFQFGIHSEIFSLF
jgi:hypothetical protein